MGAIEDKLEAGKPLSHAESEKVLNQMTGNRRRLELAKANSTAVAHQVGATALGVTVAAGTSAANAWMDDPKKLLFSRITRLTLGLGFKMKAMYNVSQGEKGYSSAYWNAAGDGMALPAIGELVSAPIRAWRQRRASGASSSSASAASSAAAEPAAASMSAALGAGAADMKAGAVQIPEGAKTDRAAGWAREIRHVDAAAGDTRWNHPVPGDRFRRQTFQG